MQGINISDELFDEVRLVAYQCGVSVSEFMVDAFQAETRRLEALTANPNLATDDDVAADQSPEAVAERALRRALDAARRGAL